MPDRLHVFLDNSNVWIEGQRAASGAGMWDERKDGAYRLDFGELLGYVAKGREVVEANLYGSEPPPNDSVWNMAKQRGFMPKVFARNFSNREKKVDTQLCVDVTRSVYSHTAEGRVLVLVAGDSDYMPAIEVALMRKWKVEVFFWANAARELRSDSRFTFIDLTADVLRVGFRAQ